MTGSWKGRGNQYIQFVKVLYCKLPTNDKQLPAFPLEVGTGTEPQSQRWEARASVTTLPPWSHTPHVDLYATCLNHKVPLYVSPVSDQHA